MDNNQTPKFDPETGRPLEQQPQPKPQAKFDPETGRPLEQPAQPQANFDPETGRPLGQPTQPQANFDPVTGRPLGQPTQPQYTQPVKEPANVPAILSLVFGILSLLCCCWEWLALSAGIASIILAIASRKNGKFCGMAIGGLVCGIIGCVFGLSTLIFGAILTSSGFYQDFMDEFMREFDYLF